MSIIPPSSPSAVVVVSATVAAVCLVLVIRPTAPRSTRGGWYLLAGLAGATLWCLAQVLLLSR